MKLLKFLGVAFLIFGLTRVSMIGQQRAPVGNQMTVAAEKFLATLPEDLRKKATFDFDSKERTGWYFTPQQKDKMFTRKGVRFEEMSKESQEAALGLLKTGTSEKGYKQATTIMSLENVLKDLEKNGVNVRNPNWYFVSVFGTPSKTGSWGWRLEGHHMSVNFTVEQGQVKSVTPFFFGANPAEVKSGDRKGLRTLPEVEDLARDLFKSLDESQQKEALQTKLFPEIPEAVTSAKPVQTVGISGEKLNATQKAKLKDLIQAYTNRIPAEVAEYEWKAINTSGGVDKVYFAYAGTTESGKPYTYHIVGPTFQVEFLNVQADGSNNPANHIHSVWRHLPSDFGL
ncbi:DUF3500 domain-containing protein [Telmatocola sphagniphila]|uniref:DUF3500 domain-containing protein n=1 Tax=Telmatocola sphagniphila TaxID=1123043 RepID=A0A8E6B955_9BACT|nr:DUF3500 domain-containing protein [Telmatocola sphagniphila]QVL32838.1 DUF3500 domain-containing protein [Telmatocola sphagniphila]